MAREIGIIKQDEQQRQAQRREIGVISPEPTPEPTPESRQEFASNIPQVGRAATQALSQMIGPAANLLTSKYEGGAGPLETVGPKQILQRIGGIAETGIQGATSGLGQVAGGLAGLGELAAQSRLGRMVLGIEGTPLGKLYEAEQQQRPGQQAQRAAQTVKRFEEALTYEPRFQGAKNIQSGMGEVAQMAAPVAVPVMRGFEAAKEKAGEIAGPAGYAAVGTIPAAIAEIGALKIAKGVKRGLIDNLIKQADANEIIDAGGALKKEIKKQIEFAGFSEDELAPVIDFAKKQKALEPKEPIEFKGWGEQPAAPITPEARPQPPIKKEPIPFEGMEEGAPVPTDQELKRITEGLAEASQAKVLKTSAMRKYAKSADIDPNIVNIAEREGVLGDMPLAAAAKGYEFGALHQGLASRPGSPLAASEYKYLQTLGEKTNELLSAFGKTKQKTDISDAYRNDAAAHIDNLSKEASKQYDRVRKTIYANAKTEKVPIKAENILNHIENVLKKIPDESDLSALESKVYAALKPERNPTYETLDRLRKKIGEGYKGKGDAAFKDAPRGELDLIYGLLSADQKAAAARYGAGDLYEGAKKIVRARKVIEGQLKETIGKDLSDNITKKARQATLDLAKAETKNWDNFSKNIPDFIGPEKRREIFVTALGDAMAGPGFKKGDPLNYIHFDNYMKSIKGEPGAVRRIVKEIGPENWQRLAQFHELVGGARRAFDKRIWTGRARTVPGMIDEVRTMSDRLRGAAKAVRNAIPGLRPIVEVDTMAAGSKARHMTAGELLDNPKFKNILFDEALGRYKTADQVEKVNRALNNSRMFQKWKSTLSGKDLEEFNRLGPLEYLRSKKTE